MDFENICMTFTMQEPYYGIILSSMNRKPVPPQVCGTMAVTRSGNVFELWYNPQFVESLPVDTALEAVKHECLHVCFNHLTLFDTEPGSRQEHDLRNIAMDAEVNCYINRGKLKKDVGWVFAENLGFEPMLGTMEYYRLLKERMEKLRQEEMASRPIKPCNGGKGGSEGITAEVRVPGTDDADDGNGDDDPAQDGTQAGSQGSDTGDGQGNGQDISQDNGLEDSGDDAGNGHEGYGSLSEKKELESLKGFDSHEEWPDGNEDPAEAECVRQMVESLVVRAAEETARTCGEGAIPQEMRQRIDGINRRARPVADWKRYFRRYVGNGFTDTIRKSRKRESRRFPDAAGNRRQRKSNILVAIDTSGSINMSDYREFFGQLGSLYRSASFHVLECDNRIRHEYDFDGRIHDEVHGGGGTSFRPVIDYYNGRRKQYDCLVYFTDGYCDIPKDTPKDTLWVISSDGNQKDRSRYRVNGASVVCIRKRNK